MNPIRLLFVIGLFTFNQVAKADPIITEFMADNKTSIKDEDNDPSDWVEIYNPDNAAVNMNGWYLTDKLSNLTQWQFPAVSIPSKGFLIVWASSKNRRIVGQNLHSNFGLSKDGESLALTKPDGVTKTSQYTFPAQFEDVSYGLASSVGTAYYLQQGSPAKALVPTSDTLGTTWRNRSFDDSAWTLNGALAAGFFNLGGSSSPDYSTLLGLDLKTAMGTSSNNKSTYIRVPFEVADPTKVQKLTFRINYDDGFAAYLNGVNIASDKIPSPLLYNSNSNGTHTAGTFVDYDVTSSIASLVAGTNILAIQGLNAGNSSDFFILPELTALVDSGSTPVTGYFSSATPNAANGGSNTIQLPQSVTFSAPSGPFTTAFNLTLSGTASGQQIRYVLADPTGTPAAAIAEPTTSSTLYTGSIAISSSKMIRAAVFNPSSGQKGKTITAQYMQLETGSTNNTSNFTSQLPIVVFDDHGDGEPVDSSTGTYTTAMLYIFNTVNGVASLNSTPTFSGRAGFRVRGRTSSTFPKKGYGLETWNETNDDLKVSLLGLATDSDWIFTNPYKYDDVFFHNAFIFEISRRIGRWAPQTRLIEAFTNSNGATSGQSKLDYTDYTGLYELSEKIEVGKNRVDITELESDDIAGDAVTGGYIFKIDDVETTEVGWTTTQGVKPVIVEPDVSPDQIVAGTNYNPNKKAQVDYLKNYVKNFEDTLYAERNANFTTRNYQKYIDVPSFIDHSMLEILAFNVDAFVLSAYFNKDRNGKIKAGPIWDFDRALNSDDGRDANPRQWNGMNIATGWWAQLLRDPEYVQAWVDRWWELRQNQFSDANLGILVDQLGNQVGAAAGARDAARWPEDAPESGSYLGEVAAMKNWLTSSNAANLGRTNWIDSQFPKAPATLTDSGVLAAGSTISLSGTGTIRYTTDGTDPRPSGGGSTSSAQTYGSAITLGSSSLFLTARTQGTYNTLPGAVPIGWGPPLTRVYLVDENFAAAGELVVSEINYSPLAATAAEKLSVLEAAPDDFEFIELKNVSNHKINTFEVSFADGTPFQTLKLSALSLAPGDTALVVKNKAAFTARYGSSNKIVGEWKEGSLSNSGELITLLARDGSPLQNFTFSSSGLWPSRADGQGSSLEYIGTTFADADYNNPVNWRDSSEIQGSPGSIGTGPDTRVVINEILAHSNTPRVDAIELFNNSASPVDISGWYISDIRSPDTVSDFKQFHIPSSTILAAGAYKVYTEADFNPNGTWNTSAGTQGAGEFAFDAHHGDTALLIQGNVSGAPVKFIDDVTFGATPSDESIGRWPNGTGYFYPMLTRTLLNESSSAYPQPGLGAANNVPRVGPVIVNEIQHSPLTGGNDVEFIEIRNTGATPQSLAHWSLVGSVKFNFAASDSVPAGGMMVVVPFASTETAKVTAFRNKYSISSAVPLVGPWTNNAHLDLSGDIALYRADSPPPDEPNYYPLLTEDETFYFNTAPWPNAAGGLSLNRRGNSSVGDIYSSWKADVPSPGSFGPTYAQWKALYFPTGGTGSNDVDDPDNDGASNSLEYSRGTNPNLLENQAQYLPVFAWQDGGSDGSYVFTFNKPVDRPGAQYTVQQSSDLVTWTGTSDILVSTTLETETRRVTIQADGSNPIRLFFRLKITTTP